MVTRTAIKNRIARKTNPIIADTMRAALKQKAWTGVARILSGSTRTYAARNLAEIDAAAKDGAVVVVPGKVLGSGSITKKLSIYALSFSASAEEKLKNAKITHGRILDAIESNQKASGVVIVQ